MKKTGLSLILCALLAIGIWSASIRADEVAQRESEVQEIENDLEAEQEKQKKAEENAAWIRYLRGKLQTELDEAQLELDAILDELNDLNKQTEDVTAFVDYYLQQRVESEERLAAQKEAMALRIQYTYETSSSSLWEILFGAKSLGEILNSAEYISSMSTYDREMREAYEATLAECSENLELMRAEEDRLVGLLAQQEEKEAEYTAKTNEMLAKIEEYNRRAAAYTEQAEVYAAEVAETQEKLVQAQEAARKAAEEAARRKAEEEAARRRAEEEAARQKAEADARRAAEEAARRKAEEEARQKAAEEAARQRAAAEAEAARKKAEAEAAAAAAAAEQARIEAERQALLEKTAEEKRAAQEQALIASDRRAVGSIIIDGDLYNPSGYTNLQLLAAIIDCEAGGQTYEGKVAVGNVIMNRILDPRFQTTIYDVVYGPGQFSPVKNGFLARKLAQGATDACYEAARDVLNGVWVIPKEYLYFCTPEAFAKLKPRHTHQMTVCWHVFYY